MKNFIKKSLKLKKTNYYHLVIIGLKKTPKLIMIMVMRIKILYTVLEMLKIKCLW